MLLALSDQLSVEVEGTAEELQQLSTTMKACSQLCEVLLMAPEVFDDRGLHYLTKIMLSVTVGPLVTSVSDRTLLIAGEKRKLDLLSENVDWLCGVENHEDSGSLRPHIHVDYYPGHFFLSEDALPLVFSLQD